ncbi:MAG: DUF4258 domain-containing protein [Armatimonadetes bacterium]|nr:DUF4258 domain-containing protein [Armatimonadota bacterium]
MIIFTDHAKEKFAILKNHGFPIAENDIIKAIESPERIKKGKRGRKISEIIIDDEHLLRVVYEKAKDKIVVVTFYPARRKRYESKV